jgi:hypothetical protein
MAKWKCPHKRESDDTPDSGFRFKFISRKEPRPHVQDASAEDRFWLEPGVEFAQHYGRTEALAC